MANNVKIERLNHAFQEEISMILMTEIKDDLYDTGKYLISTIKALKLFILYYKGSPFMRLDMLSRVQKIIDGDMYLEELLDYYGINEKVDKDLVKHLTR